jgi:hypothetical protein
VRGRAGAVHDAPNAPRIYNRDEDVDDGLIVDRERVNMAQHTDTAHTQDVGRCINGRLTITGGSEKSGL